MAGASEVVVLRASGEMLAHSDTHPAILQLFAQTATQLHSGASWFSRAREYPSLEHSEVPISNEAAIVHAINS